MAIAVCTGLVLWRGSLLILAGTMTVGALTVFLAYLAKFFQPVRDLAQMTNSIAQVSVAFERVVALMDTDTVIPDNPTATAPPAFRGDITFDHVAFGYDPESAGAPRHLVHHRAGPDGRHRRRHRQRQVHDRQPHPAVPRSGRRR